MSQSPNGQRAPISDHAILSTALAEAGNAMQSAGAALAAVAVLVRRHGTSATPADEPGEPSAESYAFRSSKG